LENYEANASLKSRALWTAQQFVGRADAQDVVGETLIEVCLHAYAPAAFEPFFLRSVKNRALNWRRDPDTGRTCSIDSAPEPVCDMRPDDEYIQEEMRRTVLAALCRLSSEDQQVLLMRVWDDISESEIAQRLGITHDAARKRLQRARERLRAEFDERCP
jgi:RNA polymerase sigma factor (sigma-70 family)